MSAWLLVCPVALAASALTFVSGFGLGTLLLPAFALFFPPAAAVAMTAVVHLANNLSKLALLARHADWRVAARFGLPALAAAPAGALLLDALARAPALARWGPDARHAIEPAGLAIAALMAALAIAELHPRWSEVRFAPRWMPLGGLASGFLGGVSGHQGALRAAFLVRAGLSKEALVATGVVVACAVDLGRLAIYGAGAARAAVAAQAPLVGAAIACALAGALVGNRLLAAVTLRGVRRAVGAMLLAIAALLAAGLV